MTNNKKTVAAGNHSAALAPSWRPSREIGYCKHPRKFAQLSTSNRSTIAFVPWLLASFCFVLVHPFSATSPTATASWRRQTSLLQMVNNPMALRRGITLPLLDISDPPPTADDEGEEQTRVVLPLPSDHLPAPLRDLNVYGMQFTRPVHKRMLEDAVERAATGKAAALMGLDPSEGGSKPLYGHLAWKPNNNNDSGLSLVGAIGCVAEVLLESDGSAFDALMGGGVDDTLLAANLETSAQAQAGEDLPKTVVVCGSFRFIVKEVVQEVPFPIVVVDELIDQAPGSAPIVAPTESPAVIEYNDFDDNFEVNDDNDDDEEDNEMYSDMEPNDIIRELFQTLQSYVDQKVEEASNQQVTLLEQSILEDTGLINPVTVELNRAEQVAATWISFRTSLFDICPLPNDRYYAAAMMAAEVVNLNNSVRRKMLTMIDGVERLRYVLREVKDTAGMARARKVAQDITETTDEDDKDLQVGKPELPPWSRQITKGMKVQYYWNEEWEWCDAEVVEDPVMIVDELLVTLRFEDGEIHKLPFDPGEKARWRPA